MHSSSSWCVIAKIGALENQKRISKWRTGSMSFSKHFDVLFAILESGLHRTLPRLFNAEALCTGLPFFFSWVTDSSKLKNLFIFFKFYMNCQHLFCLIFYYNNFFYYFQHVEDCNFIYKWCMLLLLLWSLYTFDT